ncbi:MAG: cob(I)yrinic acid a,c-diamide adenosyltransferase [Lachnospiraceae bacterium]|nr:cob(I)yrinic acid a,c-diamide adenosyltransferase [Lachnospiraceae bacterium]MDO5551045.1 cob(I)yrinic acid a,c-diamide adenosyltransferase [Lachnospiraceae bacterium]
MKKGAVQVICGSGKGKTNAAIGRAISALAEHESVIMIQFMKGNQAAESKDVLARLEPELKVFRFEKSAGFFETLSQEQKAEEMMNIRNGLNFARKVMATGECDLLILDEILGIVDCGIITAEDLIHTLEARESEMSVVLTGKVFPKELERYVDHISMIQDLKVDKSKEE